MNTDAIHTLLTRTDTLRTGHYLLTSGRHSGHYVQCANLMQSPRDAAAACAPLAEHFKDAGVQLVLSAAVGGMLTGYETARQLGVRMIYAEKREGVLTLRRGFTLSPGTRVLIVEDTVSTGKTLRELMEIVRALGGETVGAACLVDTAGGTQSFPCPYFPLHTLTVARYSPLDCPLCRKGLPLDNA